MTTLPQSGSLRQLYLEWVEDQIETYKEAVSRSELLSLADQVVDDIRVNQQGQYQLTEVLLCDAIDRRIFRLLKLPSYRTWSDAYRATHRAAPDPHTAPSADSPITVSF